MSEYLYGIREVFDHPLAYLSLDEVEALRGRASRREFPMLDALPDDAVLIGVFGFINEYKGIGTAIQALQHLPKNHHLLIFGGVHPQEIALRKPRHPYISKLFEHGFVDTTLYDELGELAAQGAPRLVVEADRGLPELLGRHPKDLSDRIHFMGAQAEPEFLSGMAVCDAVVFPVSRSRTVLIRADLAGPRTRLPDHRLAHACVSRIRRVSQQCDRVLRYRQSCRTRRTADGPPAIQPAPGLPEFNVDTNREIYRLANSRMRASRRDAEIEGAPDSTV